MAALSQLLYLSWELNGAKIFLAEFEVSPDDAALQDEPETFNSIGVN
jgi:hypothetical protein